MGARDGSWHLGVGQIHAVPGGPLEVEEEIEEGVPKMSELRVGLWCRYVWGVAMRSRLHL